jgi:succinate dehydrogenase/fumarate reductase flavoprotein subunit
MEPWGCKIRDVDDEFKGAEFRDEESKFCFAYDYVNKLHFRVWGTTFKPALYNECKRLGIQIYDRTQATSLLTDGGKQGARVVGATGLNIRTGEFYIFKAKATVMTLSRPQRIWQFDSELGGFSSLRPHNNIGNGHAMAWRAGAALTQMEKSQRAPSGDHLFPNYGTGNPFNTWYACTMVDADGKEIPWVDRDGRILQTVGERYRPSPGQKFFGERSQAYDYRHPTLIPDLANRIMNGEYKLPLYADLPGMPEMERKVIFGMMVGEEGKTEIPIVKTYKDAGFDPNKDMLQSYGMLSAEPIGVSEASRGQIPLPQQRTFGEYGDAGGLLVDWDLKTTLDGLYAAGDQLFAGNYHHHASTTGRYAGRKAAEYAMKAANPAIDRKQVEDEKRRVYAPTQRSSGVEWKEFNAGLCRVMQNYCGDPKSDELLKLGLIWLDDMEQNVATDVYATDPHKLGRTLDVLDLLTNCQIIINACMARKASSKLLDFNRLDYPQLDPKEWHKWITVKQEDGNVKIGELPIDFWGSQDDNYKAHNKGYGGWYKY